MLERDALISDGYADTLIDARLPLRRVMRHAVTLL